MSEPMPRTDSDDVLEEIEREREDFRRRLAERGIFVRMAGHDPDWQLPEPVDLKGLSLSDIVIRERQERLEALLPAWARRSAARLAPSRGLLRRLTLIERLRHLR